MLDTWCFLYNHLTKAMASLALLHCPLKRYFCGEWTLQLQVIEGTDCVNTLLLWCTVLLLVPTRELALQTSQVCKELAKHLNIQIMVTTGGTSLRDDIMRLYQPVHLLVGTPGRVLDLANKGVCNLRECTMLVMDEVRAVLLFTEALGLSYRLGWSFTLEGCDIQIAQSLLTLEQPVCPVQMCTILVWNSVLIFAFLSAGW
jgi:hypothetical protein